LKRSFKWLLATAKEGRPGGTPGTVNKIAVQSNGKGFYLLFFNPEHPQKTKAPQPQIHPKPYIR
jgi:hypothetical protein